MGQRIENYGAFIEYTTAVWARTEAHLACLDPSTLTDVIIAKQYPPQVAST